jgi:serine O-acetyltransferase
MTPSDAPVIQDRLVEWWLDELVPRPLSVPEIGRVWKIGHEAHARGDYELARRCETLNMLLHTSAVPSGLAMGERTHFGSGGIGLVLHRDAEIGSDVTFGAGVTLGGGRRMRTRADGTRAGVPRIEDGVYLAGGCKVLGGVTVGELSIIGANAVVADDVAPLSIVAGLPARQTNVITPENCLRYKSIFVPLRGVADADFVARVASLTQASER